MDEPTILIVDDNPVNLKVLRALLSKDNYTLIAANTGQAALDMVRANPSFDLIILDVVLPDINGIEVCRKLKQDPSTAHIPIILISAQRTDEQSVSNGLETGADGYLSQPIDDRVLRTWVKTVLRIRGLQRQAAAEQNMVGEDDLAVLERIRRLAHAVNNPLQALYAATDMLSFHFKDDPRAQTLLTEILVNAEKVAELVGETSIMARQRLETFRNKQGPQT